MRVVQRHPARALLALAVAAAALATAVGPSRARVAPMLPAPRVGGDVQPYRGLGTWVDIFDSSYKHPGAAVRSMAAKGVRTLYLETSNYRHNRPFVHRGKVAQFLDAATRYGLKTVAWYLPSFRRVRADYRRSLAAIRLHTNRGNGFDSFALDIESPEVRDPSTRTHRLLRLSAKLRSAVGSDYPLGGIIPSPYGMQHAGRYWPRFPYAQLTSYYDVILPMSYSTWHVSGLQQTQRYTERNIVLIRRETGISTFPIHVIGGIANHASVNDTRGFARAVRERGVLGASFYTFPLTRGKQWRVLRHVPANPVERPALPTSLQSSSQGLGNIPGGDRTHPKEIFFRTGGKRGAWILHFDAFDVQRNEVEILVNWRTLGRVAPGRRREWAGGRTRRIPDRYLRRRGANVIAFVARGDYPRWTRWGVRSVSLSKRRPSGAASPATTAAPPGAAATSPAPTGVPAAAPTMSSAASPAP